MTVRVRTRKFTGVSTTDLRRSVRAFLPALRGQRRQITVAVTAAAAVTALNLLRPWPITWIVDHLVASGDPSAIDLRLIGLLALVVFAAPLGVGLANERLELAVARISRKATVRIRSDVFEHLQRVHLDRHQQFYSGDLLVRLMGDVNLVRDLVFPSWLQLASRASIIIFGSIVFAFVDWRLFLVSLIPLPLLWLSVDRGARAIKQAAGKQRRKEGAIAAEATQALRQIRLIKAFTAEDQTTARFRSNARSAERATMAAATEAARMARLTEVLTGAGVALVLVMGAVRVRGELLSVGELILVISYTRMIYKPIRKLTTESSRLAKATASALRVLDVLELPTEDRKTGLQIGSLRSEIVFDNVAHSYPDGRESLSGLSATIPAGTLVAVVGENGTGKSTALSLLLRLFSPTSGEIRIGGLGVELLQLDTYRQQIAYVPQELSLFDGTIRDNIAFGKPQATDAEIEAAADAALLTDVLEQLPDGLDTELDEDGASLSGGQARRVMLARAAVRDASLLLLDEPFAGLDSDAHRIVARAIRQVAAGRTTIVVHHGSLEDIDPDQIVVLGPRLRAVDAPVVLGEGRAVND